MTNELTKPKSRKKRRAYPDKYRKTRAALIRKTKPWTKSTGPRSEDGKAAAAQNALKHGLRTAEMDELRVLLRLQAQYLKSLPKEYF